MAERIPPDPPPTPDATVALIFTPPRVILAPAFSAITMQTTSTLQDHRFQQDAASGTATTPRSSLVAPASRPTIIAIAADGPVYPLGMPGGPERPASVAPGTARRERTATIIFARIRATTATPRPGFLDGPGPRQVRGAIGLSRTRAPTGPVPTMAGTTAAVGTAQSCS